MITKKELEQIKKGAPFWTVSGDRCELLKSDLPGNQPLAVYVDGEKEVFTYSENGLYLKHINEPSGWDLTTKAPDQIEIKMTVRVRFSNSGLKRRQLERNLESSINCITDAQLTFSTDAKVESITVEPGNE